MTPRRVQRLEAIIDAYHQFFIESTPIEQQLVEAHQHLEDKLKILMIELENEGEEAP